MQILTIASKFKNFSSSLRFHLTTNSKKNITKTCFKEHYERVYRIWQRYDDILRVTKPKFALFGFSKAKFEKELLRKLVLNGTTNACNKYGSDMTKFCRLPNSEIYTIWIFKSDIHHHIYQLIVSLLSVKAVKLCRLICNFILY